MTHYINIREVKENIVLLDGCKEALENLDFIVYTLSIYILRGKAHENCKNI